MTVRKKPDKTPAAATTHRYTNTFPLIFPTLHHADTHVIRANPALGTDGEPIPEAGIIILHQGDEITLPDGYEHAWLERINQPDEGDSTDEEQQS